MSRLQRWQGVCHAWTVAIAWSSPRAIRTRCVTSPRGTPIAPPSGFRTDWAGRSANEAQNEIADYAVTAGANRRTIRGYSGNQPGDPVRAAEAIVKAVEAPNPPLHLLLGKAALKGAHYKLDLLRSNFDAWEATTVGADFPEGE